MSLWDEMLGRHPNVADDLRGGPPTEPDLPPLPNTDLLEVYQALPAVQPARGENDDLIVRTFNGLRGADLELPQPPQSPAWTGAGTW